MPPAPGVPCALTTGPRQYDFGDTAETTPLMMMHTLGHRFAQCEGTIPAPESAHAVHSALRHALAAYESYLNGTMDRNA